jgi:hypothetical protein
MVFIGIISTDVFDRVVVLKKEPLQVGWGGSIVIKMPRNRQNHVSEFLMDIGVCGNRCLINFY